MYKVILFMSYGICSGLGLILLKMAVSEPEFSMKHFIMLAGNLKFLMGFGLYVAGFLLWLFILSKYRLNVAFPIAMSIFFAISSLGSYFILAEPFNIKHIIGIALCFTGILFIGMK